MKNHENKLFEAVYRGSIEDTKSALRSGANIDSLDEDARTVLIHATIDRNIELVKFLLENGADVNIKDFQKMTPLHFAAQNYDIDTCKCLVAAGAVIDAQDDNGNTPLWRAEFESVGSTVLQQFLLLKGANEDLKNYHDVSPKDLKQG